MSRKFLLFEVSSTAGVPDLGKILVASSLKPSLALQLFLWKSRRTRTKTIGVKTEAVLYTTCWPKEFALKRVAVLDIALRPYLKSHL